MMIGVDTNCLSASRLSSRDSKISFSEDEGPETLHAAKVFSATSNVLSEASLPSATVAVVLRAMALSPAKPLCILDPS